MNPSICMKSWIAFRFWIWYSAYWILIIDYWSFQLWFMQNDYRSSDKVSGNCGKIFSFLSNQKISLNDNFLFVWKIFISCTPYNFCLSEFSTRNSSFILKYVNFFINDDIPNLKTFRMRNLYQNQTNWNLQVLHNGNR